MNDLDLSEVLSLLIPDWKAAVSGTIAAITPLLVMVIFGIALTALGYAGWQAKKASNDIKSVKELIKGIDPSQLLQQRESLRIESAKMPEKVSNLWREFDESLVESEGRLYNTLPAEEYFNDRTLVSKLTQNRLLAVTPTALTTLGLLGTFIGLAIGLARLELGSTNDELRESIQVLVTGAAVGFTASLWGVGGGLITNLVLRAIERKVTNKIVTLQTKIDAFFIYQAPEQSLSEIAAYSLESKVALQELHEKLGTTLQNAMATSIEPFMKDLTAKATNQSVEVFEEVSRNLTQSFTEIGVNLSTQLKESSDAMRSTIDYMGERMSQHSDSFLQELDKLNAETITQMRATNEATRKHQELIDESLPAFANKLDESTSLLNDAAISMRDLLAVIDAAAGNSSQTAEKLQAVVEDSLSTLHTLTTSTASSINDLMESHKSLANLSETSQRTAQLLGTATESFSSGFDGMKTNQEVFLRSLSDRVNEYSKTLSGWLAEYSDSVSQHTDNRMEEWNKQTDLFTSQMVNATEALASAIDELSALPLATSAQSDSADLARR